MTNTLTSEQTAKVFGMYAPCKAKSKQSGYVYTVRSIDYISGYICAFREGKSDVHLMPKQLELILTPLSEITDEHAIEVAKLAGLDVVEDEQDTYSGKIVTRSDGKISVAYWHELSSYEGSTPESDVYQFTIDAIAGETCDMMSVSHNSAHIIDQLRAWGYHLPYFGIDLYEAGIAIKPSEK